MNYIRRLKYSLAEKEAELAGLREGIQNLKAYLASDKFRIQTSVNLNDILLRLQEAEQNALRRLEDQVMKSIEEAEEKV